MKRTFKIFTILIVILSFFSLDLTTTEAATKKIAHVNIKSGTLIVRSGAGAKYKKVGELKKDAGVYVYSKTKTGWSEIRYQQKKAYVATKYLKFANSYLMDKAKTYTYIASGEKYKEIYLYSDNGMHYWESNNNNIYVIYENKIGLFNGVPEGHVWTNIEYPVRVGKTFGSDYDGFQAKITSVSKTVKVPAGTFKNCIEIKYKYTEGDVYTSYYAKNVGHIKTVHNGITTSLLIKLEKNK